MFRDQLVARLAEMGATPDYPRLVTEVLGIRGAHPELARRLVTHALLMENRAETWRRVGQRVCRNAPHSAGVYIFRDAIGRALYVGKAANLHRRLHSHFGRRRWLTLKPAMASVVSVECQEVGSEIEALIREATLIRRLQPTVNVQIGRPVLRTRVIPRALLRDVLIVLPSVAADSAELLAAKPDGRWQLRRASRIGTDLVDHAECLWQFFHAPTDGESTSEEGSLAPLIFSWLAGRGSMTTRMDPHEAHSTAHLCASLETLLKDRRLFTERLLLR
jgi:predicted GIY-YIG superfamily endonuclease